jgi:3-hydroxybutyryl-CoA dehydrogenase
MTTKTIGVIGGGTMGGGIAQVAASAGIDVIVMDVSDLAVARCIERVNANFAGRVAKGKMDAAEKDAALGRIRGAVGDAAYREFNSVDMVIEAATEDYELKANLLRQVDAALRPESIIASNTSSVSITRLAATTSRPDRFLGLHFFNPVPAMALVEIVCGMRTSDATRDKAVALARQLGKSPIIVKNAPGFVVNRLLLPMLNEAFFLLAEGVAKPEDIDEAMKLGCNHPIGPLALADLIGLDVLLAVMETLQADTGEPKYRPAPLLKELVAAGYLGRKSGRGVHRYDV